MRITKEILRCFCDPTSIGLSEPVIQKGMVYASDSHILIKTPITEELSDLEEKENPGFYKIIPESLTKLDLNKEILKIYKELDLEKRPKLKPLPKCTCYTCPSCGGTGEVELEHDFRDDKKGIYETSYYTVDCKYCEEIEDDCPLCGTSAKLINYNKVHLNSVNFNEEYFIKLLKIFGNDFECYHSQSQTGVYVFQKNETQIAIMPLRS
jgi:hypothetical protein